MRRRERHTVPVAAKACCCVDHQHVRHRRPRMADFLLQQPEQREVAGRAAAAFFLVATIATPACFDRVEFDPLPRLLGLSLIIEWRIHPAGGECKLQRPDGGALSAPGFRSFRLGLHRALLSVTPDHAVWSAWHIKQSMCPCWFHLRAFCTGVSGPWHLMQCWISGEGFQTGATHLPSKNSLSAVVTM